MMTMTEENKKLDIFVVAHPELCDNSVEIYDPDSKLVCITNRYIVFLDICLQIMRHYGYNAPLENSGYYCIFNNIKIDIRKNGSITQHPEGFFDIETYQLQEMCGY